MSAQHTPWQIKVDGFGYPSIHETAEDGRAGDLVAHCFADNEHLIRSAPELLAALEEIANPIAAMQRRASAEGASLNGAMAVQIGNDPNYLKDIARAAIAKARGAA